MIKRNPTPFFVINENINAKKFAPYDIMPYLIDCYKDARKKKKQPKTFDEFKEFVNKSSLYMYWARCQYEIVLNSWPCGDHQKKIDVHWQINMNKDLITRVLMENVGVKL